VADVVLPGNPTRLDYQALDPRRNLLFIAHLVDGQVIVVDTSSRHVVTTIPNVSRVHGVIVVPQLSMVYASATGTNEVVGIDESSFKITARMPGGKYPDGMAFDPVTGHLFVSDELGRTETVLDTKTYRRLATIDLGGEAGNTQYDPVSKHMFVNVQTLGELFEIDTTTNTVVGRTTLPGCESNHGLLIDAGNRRAFVACADNAKLLSIDMHTMKVISTWKVGDDPDVLALDPKARRLYVAAESGILAIFSDRERVTPLALGYLAASAHTVVVDPQTHLVYFPLEYMTGKPLLWIMKPR
jgi:DNA-binding beta-propeller fold protein YncE